MSNKTNSGVYKSDSLAAGEGGSYNRKARRSEINPSSGPKGPMGGPPRGFKGPAGGAFKAKNFGKSWKMLLGYSKSYVPWMIIAVAAAVAAAVLSIVGPNILSQVTDHIQNGLGIGIDLAAVGKLCGLLVILYSLSVLFNYVQGFIMTSVGHKVSYRMRDAISRKINRMPLKYFDSSSTGDVLSRVTNDVDGVASNLSNVSTLVVSVTMLIGSVIMMLVTHWVLALAAMGASILGFASMGIIIGKSQKHFVAQQQELGKINGQIEEVYSGHQVVKAYSAEGAVRAEFDSVNNKLFSSGWKSQFASGVMMPLMGFVGNIGYVAVCVVGAVLVIRGSATFGDIVAFMVYIRLFNQPMSQMAQVANALQATAAAAERVFEFLDEGELTPDKSDSIVITGNVRGEVEFDNVKFGYLPGKTVINDFSAHVKAGQKVAIVGPTGAGKTTIVNLLMRFYETDSGEIKIDGISVKDMTRANVHDLFCMVLQDTWLFNGTVKENIKYSKPEVTDVQIIDACKLVGIDHFVRTLPHGYDTVLDENVAISAGQKQLLTIARAVVEDAPLLILDEATSSVDTRTEALIQRAMDELTKGRTSFVIAHRLSTIKNADIILVLKDGDIIESGSHKDLVSAGGFYSELYNSQFLSGAGEA